MHRAALDFKAYKALKVQPVRKALRVLLVAPGHQELKVHRVLVVLKDRQTLLVFKEQ